MIQKLPKRPSNRFVYLQEGRCFGCGQNNKDGMRLRFRLDRKHARYVCHFQLDERFTGPPGHVHGGIIATLLDEAMGKINKLQNVIALTREIKIEYLKPVPLHQRLRVEGYAVSIDGRRHINRGQILSRKGEVLARGEGLFIAIDPKKVFEKQVDR